MPMQANSRASAATRLSSDARGFASRREERAAAQDLGGYFRVPPDGRDLNYGKFFDQGEPQISLAEDYNSHNTTRLDVSGMKALLLKLNFMQRIARGELATAED